MGLLEGKVAIVTGSGGGIGRCHALLFAKEGAKVVVNDLGGTRDGTGASTRMADTVVNEIKAAGGQAVANYDSVSTMEGAQNVVKTALTAFGRVDLLVNNAGILRDKTLLKMSEQEWDLVIAVHLKGTFAVTQAFAAHVKERAEKGDPGGRIVNTSSYAGLMGNFGQSNYAAAKAGIYGLTKVWALELAKIGVNVNCIAPMAKTRMTEDIAQVPDDMKPEHISPMVLFLLSDLAKDVNGKIFGIHGQQLLEYKMVMTPGVTKPGPEFWTPGEIKEKLSKIGAEPAPAGGVAAAGAAPAPQTPTQIIDKAFELMPQVFLADKAKGWNATIHFNIAGANPWTVVIADGRCTTKQGLEGTPTCVVKTDAGTYSDILVGKERPEKAFMGGKITATNLGDMMKFGGAFDMKKAKELAVGSGAPAAAAAAPAAAPAAALTPGQIIAEAFKRLPEIFVPAKAQGWTATIHFEIKGADDYTIKIADGRCSTEKGKTGTPTCVVKTDAQTYADIVTGKERAEKAFMGGKITATNLGDMMKFGTAFDMKKAQEMTKGAAPAASAAAPSAAPAAPSTPAAAIERAMLALPKGWKPEGATGWNAVVHFEIKGGEDWTVKVQDGKCEVSKGKAGTPTCIVKTDVETYAKVSAGEMKAEQAFMQQKISATNLGDMMKFGRAFDMKKVAEIAKSGGGGAAAPAAASAPSAPRKGLNRDYIGRSYSGGIEWVKGADTKAYGLATNDKNPLYLEEKIAPPLYSVRLGKEVLFKAITDPGLGADLLRLVHGEQDMEFLRPLRPGDLATMRATLTGMEEKSSGELLHAQLRIYVDGQLCVRARETMFIRGEKKGDGSKKDEPQDESAGRKIAYKTTVQVTKDQSLRYADASLDNNPIHVDDNVAKMAGLPGVILQGLCTMAFSQNAIVNEVLKGDAARLKRLAVRFAKPVLMGDVLTIEGWEVETRNGLKTYGFHVKNQSGTAVITNGVAEVQV